MGSSPAEPPQSSLPPPAPTSPAPATPPVLPTAATSLAPPAPAGTGPASAYGAGLFIAGSSRPDLVSQLVALARTVQPDTTLVAVVAGEPGVGASTTAAGVARTLATVRDDRTGLVDAATTDLDLALLDELGTRHALTIVDLGAQAGEAAPLVLTASHRLVVVTGAEPRATRATQLLLERVHVVRPDLVADAVIAVVCRTNRQFRRVSRELRADRSRQAAQIIPVPYDPTMPAPGDLHLAALREPTRTAYLRLAAVVAGLRPVATVEPAPRVPATSP